MEQNRQPRSKSMNLQQIFDKGAKNIQWRKDNLFSNNDKKIGYPHS
jgi:hypothetical protein